MAEIQASWSRLPQGNPLGLDPTKPRGPQLLSMAAQLGLIFGGPALGLVAMENFPVLVLDRTIYLGGLASIAFWFVASFALFGAKYFPAGTPPIARLLFRAAIGLCTTGLILGVAGITNGYGTPLAAREAAVVAKHPTLQSDPARRTYYAAIRAWPGSPDVVELPVPHAIYDALAVPRIAIHTPERALAAMPDAGHVRLVLGQGRLGLAWVKRIELP